VDETCWGLVGALVLLALILGTAVLMLSRENDRLHRRLSDANRRLPPGRRT
jgi:hypothetical protein